MEQLECEHLGRKHHHEHHGRVCERIRPKDSGGDQDSKDSVLRAIMSGANGLSCKIFLLSGKEVGWDSSDNQYFPNDGAKLSYFLDGTSSSANSKRVAKLNGSATVWWLRSPSTSNTFSVWYVSSDGDCGFWNAGDSYGVRPAFILPSTFVFLESEVV